MSLYSSLVSDAPNEKQSYDALKQICFATRKLFEDPLFKPPEESDDILWVRPFEFCRAPKFIADGVSRFDVKQGELGDCWFVAAMASLTLSPNLFDRVVPSNQSFEPVDYCGMFRFNFWNYGKWIEIVIDDRLPICRNSKKPRYIQSSDPSEFWSPLLEKAYAKLNSSYQALEGGDFCEAMVDFTGGLSEVFELQAKTPKNFWTIIKKGFERGSMIGCSIRKKDVRHNFDGLIQSHAYSITNVLEIHQDNNGWGPVEGPSIEMVRLRNPWGQREWNGPWSDGSEKWSHISASERKRIGLTIEDDGEFWMSFDDWKGNFTHCEMCNLTPESVDSKIMHRWHPKHIFGDWQWNQSSGGHRTWDNAAEFAKNPQYFIKLTDPDRDDKLGNCTLVVSLMQKDCRKSDHRNIIGFYVYPVGQKEPTNEHLTPDFFEKNQPIELEPKFTWEREITARFHLKPGYYVIIPATHDRGEEGQFMLRIWTEHPIKGAKSTRTGAMAQTDSSIQTERPNNNRDNNLALVRSQPPSSRSSNRANHRGTVVNLASGIQAIMQDGRIISIKHGNTFISIESSSSSSSGSTSMNTINIEYPDIPYPGKPTIVGRPMIITSSTWRRARINMELTTPNQSQPPKKERRSFLRKILDLTPAKLKKSSNGTR